MNDVKKLLVSQPDLGPAEAAAVAAVLESQWVGLGPRTETFEQALAHYLGARHVLATASCTAALHLALTALDRDDRDQVIVPSLTFAASVQAIRMAGYEPVFAEVDSETLTLDVEDAARCLGTRTRAVMPVHLAGYPCDLKRLRDLASQAGIAVVEDAAHAFGSSHAERRIGGAGEAVCFSFSSNKNITCGEGGAVATDSDALADRIRGLRFLGISRDTWRRRSQERPWEYAVDGIGFRCHMSDINAAIGLAQLSRLDGFAAKRRRIAAAYDLALQCTSGIIRIRRDLEQTIPNLYILRIAGGRRDSVYRALQAAGIVCGVHYPPNHRQPAFRAHARPLPTTEQLADEILTLPLHTRLEDSDVARVLDELARALATGHKAHAPCPPPNSDQARQQLPSCQQRSPF